MSDQSQGEGWWQASDGKWYPPQDQPAQAPPPPAAPEIPRHASPESAQKNSGCLKTVLIVIGVLVVLGVLGVIMVACIAVVAQEASEDLEKADQEAMAATTCEVTGKDVLGFYEVTIEVENTSSKRSDFFIDYVIRDADDERIGDSFHGINNVEPGETVSDEASSIVDVTVPPNQATCKLVDVSRSESL